MAQQEGVPPTSAGLCGKLCFGWGSFLQSEVSRSDILLFWETPVTEPGDSLGFPGGRQCRTVTVRNQGCVLIRPCQTACLYLMR